MYSYFLRDSTNNVNNEELYFSNLLFTAKSKTERNMNKGARALYFF